MLEVHKVRVYSRSGGGLLREMQEPQGARGTMLEAEPGSGNLSLGEVNKLCCILSVHPAAGKGLLGSLGGWICASQDGLLCKTAVRVSSARLLYWEVLHKISLIYFPAELSFFLKVCLLISLSALDFMCLVLQIQ